MRRFRTRVTFLRPVRTNEYDGVVAEPEFLRTVWASVEPLTGRELILSRQVQSEITHKIRTRWFEGLLPSDLARVGARIFGIVSVGDEKERGRWMEIMAVERIG